MGFYPSTYQVKEEFVKNFAAFIEKEVARVDRGEESILVKRSVVMFELVSKKEDEMISREESLRLGRAHETPDSYSNDLYDQLDKKKTGKLNKKDLSNLAFKLWTTLEDSEEHDILKPK